MRHQRWFFVAVVGVILLALAVFLLVGVLQGDDSSDPNGVNTAPTVALAR